jgi:HEAT repeat protein
MKPWLPNPKLLAAAALAAVLAGGLCWQRTALRTWYAVRQLAAADPEARDGCAERVAVLGEAALPAVLANLRSPDAQVCGNMAAALEALAGQGRADESPARAVVEGVAREFAHLSPAGQGCAVEVLTAVLQQEGPKILPGTVTGPAGDVLRAAAPQADLQYVVLTLAGALVERVPQGQWLAPCRALAEKGMTAEASQVRVAAVRLVLRGPLRQDVALLPKVVPLLRDPEPEVRRAALLALAPARDLVSEDDLLPLLHDDDAQVQVLCETALRSRGLHENHLLLARLISDESPRARLRVVQHLGQAADLEPTAWLRRLSHDAAPAVRAAAVRAAASYPHVDLADRLREMAAQDPSEDVRLTARHYLSKTAPSRP